MKLEANEITLEGPFELDGLYYDAVSIKGGDCAVVVPWSVLDAFIREGFKEGRWPVTTLWLIKERLKQNQS